MTTKRRIVLLHGLLRTKVSMMFLQRALANAGYEVVNLNYPSRTQSILAHAQAVAEMIQEQCGGPDSEPISLVTHSLGGIVARALIAKHQAEIPVVERLVQLAPPNQGAYLVDQLKHLWLFQFVTGQAGMQLSTGESGPAEKFGNYPLSETVEVGVIAGGKNDDKGFVPFLPGDNDGVVEVRTTFLREARDHILVPSLHTFIMNSSEAVENVKHFLANGRFCEEATRLAVPEEVFTESEPGSDATVDSSN